MGDAPDSWAPIGELLGASLRVSLWAPPWVSRRVSLSALFATSLRGSLAGLRIWNPLGAASPGGSLGVALDGSLWDSLEESQR